MKIPENFYEILYVMQKVDGLLLQVIKFAAPVTLLMGAMYAGKIYLDRSIRLAKEIRSLRIISMQIADLAPGLDQLKQSESQQTQELIQLLQRQEMLKATLLLERDKLLKQSSQTAPKTSVQDPDFLEKRISKKPVTQSISVADGMGANADVANPTGTPMSNRALVGWSLYQYDQTTGFISEKETDLADTNALIYTIQQRVEDQGKNNKIQKKQNKL